VSSPTRPFAKRLEQAVSNNRALADLTNDKGECAIDLAVLPCRRVMRRALFFLGRYEIADGPAEHRSATSLVVRAVDHEAAEDHGELFVEFDKDSDGTLDDNELTDLAARLGTNVEILKVDEGSLTKDVFVAKCQQLFGKERKVVIKIFQVEEQWENEKKARDDQQLDARYVVQTIPAPADDQFALALNESSLFKETRFGEGVGSRAIVMDAADRNLFQIYQSERPDLNTVRVLMFQVMECVDHLHERGLVHGDIKMLNVVRLALDQKLRLIDLDAAAVFDEGDGVLYVCSKFSSAILPPECFAKLDADRVTQFEAYFKGDDAERCEKKHRRSTGSSGRRSRPRSRGACRTSSRRFKSRMASLSPMACRTSPWRRLMPSTTGRSARSYFSWSRANRSCRRITMMTAWTRTEWQN